MDFSLLDMPYFVSHFKNNIECWTFFLWKVIIHIWEKHYQEKNLKSHSNVALLCKFGKMLSDLHMSHLVLFWKMSIIKVIEVFYCLQPMKNDVRFEYVSWKMFDFVSFSLFGLTLIRNLKNFDFGSHWNKQKNYMRYQHVLPNSVWFGLSFIIRVKISNKLTNADFKFFWNSLIFSN